MGWRGLPGKASQVTAPVFADRAPETPLEDRLVASGHTTLTL